MTIFVDRYICKHKKHTLICLGNYTNFTEKASPI